jgi:very-short-patch-repair endonuclease
LAKKRLTKTARNLRNNATEAERALWLHLRNRNLFNAKFTRQHPIGDHIADFACRALRLTIECDGGQHSAGTDAARTAAIEAHGYRVIRFWNHDILENIDGVLEAIQREIEIARNR